MGWSPKRQSTSTPQDLPASEALTHLGGGVPWRCLGHAPAQGQPLAPLSIAIERPAGVLVDTLMDAGPRKHGVLIYN